MFAHFFQAGDELRKVRWLGYERVRAEVVSPFYFRAIKRSGEDNHRQAHPFLTSAYPRENLKTSQPGHIQIEQQQMWNRVLLPIGVMAFTFQVLQHLLAIWHDIDRILKTALFKRGANHENVVRAVLGQQNIF